MKGFKLKGKSRELPKLPSDGILACLADLEMCEKHPNYEINMIDWHFYNRHTKRCEVCLGGARIARVLGSPGEASAPSQFPNESGKISAMDDFRIGFVNTGVDKYLNRPLTDKENETIRNLNERYENKFCPTYTESPARVKLYLKEMAAELKKVGF